jgi:Flp pilus assembly protein TadD
LVLLLALGQQVDWKTHHQRGLEATRSGEFATAEQHYREALRLNPQFAPARKNLAVVLWFLGRRAESEGEFSALLKVIPSDPVPHLYLGLAARERKQFVEATEHFEKAGDLALKNPEVLPTVSESYLGAGAAYDQQGKPEKAHAAFLKAIEVDPRSEEACLALAQFSIAHQNNEYALRVLDQGLQRIPDSPRLLHQRGIVLALLGNQEEAERSLRRAFELDPKWNSPLLAIGVSQLERGRYEDAASSFRQAASLTPGDFRAEYLYATALKRTGDPSRRDEIIAALRRAAALEPNDPRPKASLGQTLFESGKSHEAAAELEAALRLDPDNTTALYQLALLYRDLGRREDSRKLLGRFEEVKAKRREQEGELGQILKVVTEK